MSDGMEGTFAEGNSILIPKEGGGFDEILGHDMLRYPDGRSRVGMIFIHSF
jgi:hypothetical protein